MHVLLTVVVILKKCQRVLNLSVKGINPNISIFHTWHEEKVDMEEY